MAVGKHSQAAEETAASRSQSEGERGREPGEGLTSHGPHGSESGVTGAAWWEDCVLNNS